MAALISTYRHDYVAPVTNRYNFLKETKFSSDPCKEICTCVEEVPKPQLTSLGEVCEKKKWTGTAPPGKLVDPRFVPESPLTSTDGKKNACWLDQPNRFLKTISNTYPELYERLRNMPQDELRRSIENSRFRSTYQVDYCHVDEHSTRLYDQDKERQDEELYRTGNLTQPCDFSMTGGVGLGEGAFGHGGGDKGFGGTDEAGYGQEMNAEEVKMYKPVKAGVPEDNSRGPTAHWDAGAFTKQLDLTEYMDTVARTGLIIIENDLHNHSNCMSGRNCVHPIKNKDPKGLKQMLHMA